MVPIMLLNLERNLNAEETSFLESIGYHVRLSAETNHTWIACIVMF